MVDEGKIESDGMEGDKDGRVGNNGDWEVGFMEGMRGMVVREGNMSGIVSW